MVKSLIFQKIYFVFPPFSHHDFQIVLYTPLRLNKILPQTAIPTHMLVSISHPRIRSPSCTYPASHVMNAVEPKLVLEFPFGIIGGKPHGKSTYFGL